MSTFRLFIFAKEFRFHLSPARDRLARAKAVQLLCMVLVFWLVTGCGGSTKTQNPVSATIAFSSSAALDGSNGPIQGENIWLENPDGSGAFPITRLTSGVGVDHLVWSPDGSKLAFISSRALDGSDAVNINSTFNLWVINPDGSGAVPLTRLTGGQRGLDIAWSPDGRRIAFDSDRALDGSDAVNANGTSNIWVINSDGTGAVPLTRFTVAFADLPVWSPDGSRIAFTSGGALDGSDAGFTTFNVWVMNADGSGSTPVTTLATAASEYAAFSPDGARLAFVSNRALDGSDISIVAGNIWMAKVDGSGAVPLTKYTAFNAGAIFTGFWSPDGKKFAFTSTAALDGSDAANTSAIKNVWVVNTDGSGATPLTRLAYSNSGGFGAAPNGWSPDGASIAFTSDVALDTGSTPSFSNAWVTKADGSNSRPLTNLGGGSPAWKP